MANARKLKLCRCVRYFSVITDKRDICNDCQNSSSVLNPQQFIYILRSQPRY